MSTNLPRLLWSYGNARRNAGRWKNRAALERWQESAVRRQVAWVMRHSPFYRELYAGLDPADWRSFPVIGKKEMMANFTTLNTAGLDRDEAFRVAEQAEKTRDFAPTLGGFTVGLSSGTSGSRGLFAASDSERAEWAGTLLARVLPQGIFTGGQRAALFLRANSNLYRSIASRRIAFAFFDLLEPWEDLLRKVEDFAPTLLTAPPSALKMLAEARLAGRIRFRPDKICAAAEVLEPQDADFIAKAFEHQLVHQVYQATEGFLGATCAHGSLHLNEDVAVFQREELGAGRFVPIITDFRRRAQPILRYRLDDVLSERPEPCPCGSVFMAVEAVEGRCDDLLVFQKADGGEAVRVFPDFIRRAVITAHPAIEEYVVRQAVEGTLVVSLKCPSGKRPEVETAVRGSFAEFQEARGLAAVSIGFDEWIPPAPGRKLRRISRETSATG